MIERVTSFVARCDEPGCFSEYPGDEYAEVMDTLKRLGWLTVKAGKLHVYCPRHAMSHLPNCELCGGKVRPWGRSQNEFPGTVAYGKKGLCAGCAQPQARAGKAGQGMMLDEAVAKYKSFRPVELRELLGRADAEGIREIQELADAALVRHGATDLREVLALG